MNNASNAPQPNINTNKSVLVPAIIIRMVGLLIYTSPETGPDFNHSNTIIIEGASEWKRRVKGQKEKTLVKDLLIESVGISTAQLTAYPNEFWLNSSPRYLVKWEQEYNRVIQLEKLGYNINSKQTTKSGTIDNTIVSDFSVHVRLSLSFSRKTHQLRNMGVQLTTDTVKAPITLFTMRAIAHWFAQINKWVDQNKLDLENGNGNGNGNGN
ncbi:MAG: hypothetical protein EZS28_002377 [Streblomastix strix]|uniref:Uncharacterized protein n=1 Tax=Streblomastix strix TaxID=222440 RepID=A0A5J4X4D7_9EUKA|nr:MAG: hypothetical protein EZS28_002377 [Streblomastix strix]